MFVYPIYIPCTVPNGSRVPALFIIDSPFGSLSSMFPMFIIDSPFRSLSSMFPKLLEICSYQATEKRSKWNRGKGFPRKRFSRCHLCLRCKLSTVIAVLYIVLIVFISFINVSDHILQS